jgi:hypothetical protein
MIKSDFENYQTTGREGILALANDLTTAIKMEITLLDTRKFLPKYACCILQWIEKIFEVQLISKEDSVIVLDHFHNLIEACERTGNFEFNGIEISEQEIQLFFYRIKSIILLKKFVMNLSIVKETPLSDKL